MNQLPPFQTLTPQRNVSDSIFIPFIRTKRMHRKSRFGCVTCKKRRVKCDETQPKCLKCRQRGVDCVYADRPDKAVQSIDDTGLTTPKNEGASPPAQKSPASSTTTSEASPISPELDAEIARYFLEHTIKTFSNSSVRRSMHWIWHAFVPSLAYSYPTVRHGMLAVAAISLHFAHQDAAIQLDPLSEPLTSSQYMDASVAHGDIFVNESRQQLDALEPNNVDANTVATRLLSVLSFAFFRHNRQVGLDLADPRAWTWLHLTRGVYTVHSSLMAVDQVVHPIITEDMIPEQDPFPRQFTHALPIASGGQQQMLAFLNDTRVERFTQLREALDNGTFFFGSGVTATQNRTAAASAIEFLAQITEHICTWTEMSSLFRAQCSWPVQLSDDFISMLTRCDRSALAIYTHWLMLMAVGEDMWWVGDMGKAGIQMVLDLIPESDTGLQTVLARPRQLLNLTGWSLR